MVSSLEIRDKAAREFILLTGENPVKSLTYGRLRRFVVKKRAIVLTTPIIIKCFLYFTKIAC